MIGKSISHYRVTEKLGADGMGEVNRATDNRSTALGCDVDSLIGTGTKSRSGHTIKRNQIQLMVRIKNRLTSDQQAKLKQVSRKGLHGIFMEGRRHEGLGGLHEIRIERRIKSHKPGEK